MAQEKPESKIGNAPPVVAYSNARFNDCDALAEAARHWNLEFYQLDGGGFRGEMIQVLMRYGLLSRSRFMGGLQQRGAVPTGCRTFGVPLADCTPFRWRGQLLTSEHLLMFPVSGELDSRSFAGFHVYPLSLAEPLLERLALEMGYDWFFGGEERVVHSGRRTMQQLRGMAAQVIEYSSGPHEMSKHREVDHLMEDLAATLLAALDDPVQQQAKPMAQARSRALAKSLEVLEAPDNRVWRIAELCELTGVSRRTLQYAFEEKFQVSPKQYLQARRLVEVKRRLEAANQGAQVTDIASSVGFWHMGQFAADFRSHFGKLPSEVLKGEG